MPEHPQGAFKDAAVSKTIWPRRTPLRAFRGNVAHSNFDGFMFDRNINRDDTFDLSFSAFTPLANPADPNSEMVETHLENLTSYKNRNGGVWTRGELLLFRNAKLADNAIVIRLTDGRPEHPQVIERVNRIIDGMRVRAVYHVPYDEHIAERGQITLDRLAPATRAAFTAATAGVVQALKSTAR